MEITQKSTLAKLLATENISVEHQRVPTAYFDLKERKVVLPIFDQNISSDLYDLLIGHEVSHALNTPLEGWHESASTKGNGFKSYLNVIEDARIERDIKSRYPGLTKNFYKGYKELFEMDFFGLDRDINEYPLIDRINIHFKVGMFAAVDFTSEELVYVDRASKCKTWDEVVALATDLFEFAKQEETVDEDIMDAIKKMRGESDEQPEEVETEEGEDGEDSGGQEDQEETLEEEADEETSQSIESNETEEQSDDFDPVSITDTNFRDNEKLLVSKVSTEYHYGNFPKLDYRKWFDMNPWKLFDESMTSGDVFKRKVKKKTDDFVFYDEENVSYETTVDEYNKHFVQKNRAFINMMVSQFEAKRKAAQFSKARENKTGDLNMNKLWATKLTEDVFLSNTVVPDGKNHGMIMVLDFSGSMNDKMHDTIEQVLIQVSFCKKVNIPFEVYSFTERHYGDHLKHLVDNQKDGDVKIQTSGLIVNKLISSDMSKTAYKKAFSNMLIVSSAYMSAYENKPYMRRHALPDNLQMGGTPLAETVLLLRDRALDFRRENGIDVLNTLFLTDGSNTGDLSVGGVDSYSVDRGRVKPIVCIREGGIVTSHLSKNKMWSPRFSDTSCEAVLKHYDATTGSRTVNYFLANSAKSDLQNKFINLRGYDAGFEKQYKEEWLGNGFMQLDGLDGFSTAFVLRSRDLGNVTELDTKSDSKGDLVRGFRKFQKSKTTSRKFLTKFIEKIA